MTLINSTKLVIVKRRNKIRREILINVLKIFVNESFLKKIIE